MMTKIPSQVNHANLVAKNCHVTQMTRMEQVMEALEHQQVSLQIERRLDAFTVD